MIGEKVAKGKIKTGERRADGKIEAIGESDAETRGRGSGDNVERATGKSDKSDSTANSTRSVRVNGKKCI